MHHRADTPTLYIKDGRGREKAGRFAMEGGYEDAPGPYMGNCSAHNNPGTYAKRLIFRRRAHGWTPSGKRIMPEGVGGPRARPPYYERASGNKPTRRLEALMCQARAPPGPMTHPCPTARGGKTR